MISFGRMQGLKRCRSSNVAEPQTRRESRYYLAATDRERHLVHLEGCKTTYELQSLDQAEKHSNSIPQQVGLLLGQRAEPERSRSALLFQFLRFQDRSFAVPPANKISTSRPALSLSFFRVKDLSFDHSTARHCLAKMLLSGSRKSNDWIHRASC